MDMKKIFFMLVFIVLSYNVSAEISASLNIKANFYKSDTVGFDYSISANNTNVTYITHIGCEKGGPISLISSQEVFIEDIFISTYKDFEVTDEMQSQKCYATLNVQSPETITVVKEFNIISANNCNYVPIKKIYQKGESLKGLEAISSSGQKKTTLDTAGTYTVHYVKDGCDYGDIKITVVESNTGAKKITSCNQNLKCDAGESIKSCPQDCTSAKQTVSKDITGMAYSIPKMKTSDFAVIGLIFVLGSSLVYLMVRKRH